MRNTRVEQKTTQFNSFIFIPIRRLREGRMSSDNTLTVLPSLLPITLTLPSKISTEETLKSELTDECAALVVANKNTKKDIIEIDDDDNDETVESSARVKRRRLDSKDSLSSGSEDDYNALESETEDEQYQMSEAKRTIISSINDRDRLLETYKSLNQRVELATTRLEREEEKESTNSEIARQQITMFIQRESVRHTEARRRLKMLKENHRTLTMHALHVKTKWMVLEQELSSLNPRLATPIVRMFTMPSSSPNMHTTTSSATSSTALYYPQVRHVKRKSSSSVTVMDNNG